MINADCMRDWLVNVEYYVPGECGCLIGLITGCYYAHTHAQTVTCWW